MSDHFEEKISSVVDALMESYDGSKYIDKAATYEQPDVDRILAALESLKKIVFQGFFNNKKYKVYTTRNNTSMLIEDVIFILSQQITRVLPYNTDKYGAFTDEQLQEEAFRLTFAFLDKLPMIRDYIDTDVEALFEGDPAAISKDEIIFCYPGLYAIFVSRIAHELYLLDIPLIPRIMTEHAHRRTGIDIHPGATMGRYFFIDHGTGVVIGETTIIGEHVKLYQGVTLGGLSTRGGQRLKNVKRHPTIGDNVTIYSGASILGGETVIGKNVVIGGNCFITESVPDNARVTVKGQELSYDYNE